MNAHLMIEHDWFRHAAETLRLTKYYQPIA
jgi:hypothetical protein